MPTKYLFSAAQLDLFKRGAHEIRNTLRLHAPDAVPRVTVMLDIWARCLGYPDHGTLLRQSKGHLNAGGPPFRLTRDNFAELAESLARQLDDRLSLATCQWAVAGLFDLSGDRALDLDDVHLIEALLIRTMPTPLDARKQRLIDWGCLTPESRANAIPGEAGSLIVGYHVTELGRYAAGRALERLEQHPLAQLSLLKLDLPTELCRLRSISAQFTVSWRSGRPSTPTTSTTKQA